MRILETIADLRLARADLKGQVGLVPTMGYLHDGHLALVSAAKENSDSVMATIFVNPTQFGKDEDLSTYPRNLDRDFAMLEAAGIDCVFVPTPDLMYPQGFQTWVSVEEVTKGREGGERPLHFRGVTTIVNKLFNLTQPHIAFFGQKDAQQVIVIRRMVYDLNIPVEIYICPIVREPDGLALSSRNVYLSAPERQAALVLNQALNRVGEAYASGERSPDNLRQIAAQHISDEPLAHLDYVSLADASSFAEVSTATDKPLLLSVAAQLGKPRLLDNCLLPMNLNTPENLQRFLGKSNTSFA